MDYDRDWTNGNHQKFQLPPTPLLLRACAAKNRVEQAAQRIADLAEAAVTEIVCRIPDDFLAEAAREQLLGWLLWRKQQLVPAWSQWYAGS